MIKKMFGMFALVAVLVFLPASSFASTAGWEFTTIGSESTNGPWEFGEVFTVNQDITINFLGYYNPTGGMTDSHQVDLYDSLGNVLATSTINSSSAFSTSHFLYNSIAPITLLAGQTYVIEGLSGVDLYAYNNTGFTNFAPITILGNNFTSGTTPVFNGTGVINDVADGYWGANFGWDPAAAVPEPGSMAMIGAGLLGLAAALRRKRNA